MINIGICEWSLPVDGPAACKLASELGIEGIQLDIGPYERGFPKSRKVVQDAYLEAAQLYGIQFPSMAARVSDYYSMVDEPGSRDHEIVWTGISKAIEACERMNIPLILIPNFEKSFIGTERQFDIAVGIMKKACDLAAESDITIAAENTLDVEKTIEMIDRVGFVNFGVYFDFQNYFLAKNADTPDVLEKLFPYVVETHVKDGKGKDLSGALLGTGDVDFFKSMDVLKRRNYEGWIVSENYYDMRPLCGPDDDPVELIRKDIQTLRTVL